MGTPSSAFADTWLPQQSVQIKVPRQLARFLPGLMKRHGVEAELTNATDPIAVTDISKANSVSIDISHFSDSDVRYSHMMTVSGSDVNVHRAVVLIGDVFDREYDVSMSFVHTLLPIQTDDISQGTHNDITNRCHVRLSRPLPLHARVAYAPVQMLRPPILMRSVAMTPHRSKPSTILLAQLNGQIQGSSSLHDLQSRSEVS